MKLLVLEQDEQIKSIYKKFFEEKSHDADYAINESECMEKFCNNLKEENMPSYDYIITENSCRLPDGTKLEDRIREVHSDQKIFFLSKYMNFDKSELSKKTQKLIEKPFAMITLLGYLEITSPRKVIVSNKVN